MFLQTIDKIFSNDTKSSDESDASGNKFTVYEDFTFSTTSKFEYDSLVALLSPPSPQPQVRLCMIWMTVEELSIICEKQLAPGLFT